MARFPKFEIFMSAWALLAPMSAAAADHDSVRHVEFVQQFNPAPGERVELWIPAPLEKTPGQKLVSRQIEGNASVVRLGTESGGPAPFVYARWDRVDRPTLRIVNTLDIETRTGAAPADGDEREADIRSRYLAPTAHVQTDGLVKTTAAKIVGRTDDPDRKARAIYDWIVDHTERDPNVRGCGLGDVKSTLAAGQPSGKCADLNSLFVGLARASGVPAREVFGQRVAPSSLTPALGKEGDNSKAQHCRAEYWSSRKHGWVPVDPADVRKAILDDRLAPGDKRLAAIREKLFGTWEGTWVAFNYARDFVLDGYGERPVNYFMYPLLASASIRPDGVEPQETGYNFTTTVKPD